MIHLSYIAKSYTTGGEVVQIFSDLSLSIESGEFVAIMGPSGSGKSTLLGLISGLLAPDSGVVQIGSQDISKLSEDATTRFRGKNISYIFQAYELVPSLTVEENIDLPIDISGSPRRFEVTDILEKVGLTGKKNRYPGELSGGEKQRVAIARAFVSEVPYLLADEPTGNLDRTNALRVIDLLASLHKETKNTILMITHDREIAERADRILELRDGKLVKAK